MSGIPTRYHAEHEVAVGGGATSLPPATNRKKNTMGSTKIVIAESDGGIARIVLESPGSDQPSSLVLESQVRDLTTGEVKLQRKRIMLTSIEDGR